MFSFSFLGKLCIEVTPTDKIAYISEELCIGCGICSKVRAFFHSWSFELSESTECPSFQLEHLEMPFRSTQDHQSSEQLGERHNTQIQRKLI